MPHSRMLREIVSLLCLPSSIEILAVQIMTPARGQSRLRWSKTVPQASIYLRSPNSSSRPVPCCSSGVFSLSYTSCLIPYSMGLCSLFFLLL
ncbi:hypothetical protein BDW71DRAFT_174599 [Aspergillus fruticulosus]